mmetsp:Transcript_6006/g.18093  ORF Transcript_6006/g.18093 Transcript_6006/m.18093 type:complete len:445 (+) Transcript_6006:171-1505(+)
MGGKVLVVGAGPTGCATGAALASRGYEVDIVDLRSDPRVPRNGKTQTQRSINLALSTRGLTTLDILGYGDRARALGVPMPGRELHGLDGQVEFQPYGQPGQHLLSVPRTALSELLVDAAEKAGCAVKFEHKCMNIDLEAHKVSFRTPQDETTEVEADLLVGADGTFSKVRSTMMRTTAFDYSQDYLPAAYKELSMPAALAKGMRREALHIWPRHRYMLIALPNLDGSFTCTLFHRQDAFDAIKTDVDVMKLFRESFPDTIPMIPDLCSQYFSNPTPPLLTVRCNPYHYKDSALLIGDAAHAIVPFYGQGCNLALEDVRVLWELLDHYDGDFGVILPEFTRRRKRNADAIAQLAIDNYTEMASKTASTAFLVKRRLGLLLNRLAPKSFVPLYTMISFTNTPYADAVEIAANTERTASRAARAVVAVCVLATAITSASVLLRKLRR